jgi:hypothetical protein
VRPVYLVLGIWLVVIAPAAAQRMLSPEPAPSVQTLSPSTPTQEPRKPPDADQRGTDAGPLSVKIIPSQDHQTEEAEHKRQTDENAATEKDLADATWKLAWFTLALVAAVGIQIILFVWQLSLIRKSLDDAKIAAEAARDGAKAAQEAANLGRDEFNASHRPRIRVREVAIATEGFNNPPRLARDKILQARFVITNIGEAEAIITEAYAIIYKTNLPLPMSSPPMNNVLPTRFNIKPAYIALPLEFSDAEPLGEEIEKIIRGEYAWKLYVMGTITYTDIRDTTITRARRMYFCRRLRTDPHRFEREDNPDYESEN